jgi:apolipoprotein N-acyltransferase
MVEWLPSWFAERGRWTRLALAMLAGAVMTGGHAPVNIPYGFFLAVPVLIWLVNGAPTARAAAWIGWGAGFGYFVTGLHWIGHAFLVDADRFAWLLPLGVIAMPAGLSLFWAMAFWFAKRTWPPHIISSSIWLCGVWTVAEYARGNVLTGFPWALPGYVWVETPVMQAASWAGPYGISFLSLLLTALPLVGLAAAGRGPKLVTGLAVLACAALWIAGTARIPDATQYDAEAPVLRLVQPNAPQHLKWVPGHREKFYERALQATAAESDTELGPPDAFIWPETAIYFLPAFNPDEVARISDVAGNKPVLLGALHSEDQGGNEIWRNSFFSIGADRKLGERYDKFHLVPFGEYLPMASVLEALGLRQFALQGGFTPGPGPRVLTVGNLPRFSVLICYEAIFPDEIIGDERPDWLLQITNDAWFGSFAGPQQHLAQARIRSIEQGLPMVRSANTGISAIIDSYGLIVVSISLHNYNFVDAVLPRPIEPTLYSRMGDLPVVFLIVIAAFFARLSIFITKPD